MHIYHRCSWQSSVWWGTLPPVSMGQKKTWDVTWFPSVQVGSLLFVWDLMLCTWSLTCKCIQLNSNMKVNIPTTREIKTEKNRGSRMLNKNFILLTSPVAGLVPYFLIHGTMLLKHKVERKWSLLKVKPDTCSCHNTRRTRDNVFSTTNTTKLIKFLALSYLFYYYVQYYTNNKHREYWCYFNPPVLLDDGFCPLMLFNCIISHL